MDISEVQGYIRASKDVLDLLKTLGGLLPKGPQADAAQKKLEQAEKALLASEAQLAKALGYHLCQCTFPPQIMLWRERESVFICPNESCGKQIPKRTTSQRIVSRQPSDWMSR